MFVQQAVAHGYLADYQAVFLCLGGHQLAWVYAHIALGAPHQYLALCRARHRVAVEIKLWHTHAGQETATYDFQSPCLALGLYAHYATAGGAYPVGPVAVARQSFHYVVVPSDVAQRVALGVVYRHAVRVRQHHQALLPIHTHVCHHLVQPPLRVALIAEGHTARAVFQVVGPQSVHRSYQHRPCAVVAYGVGADVFAAVVGHCACSLILGVEDDGLAYG